MSYLPGFEALFDKPDLLTVTVDPVAIRRLDEAKPDYREVRHYQMPEAQKAAFVTRIMTLAKQNNYSDKLIFDCVDNLTAVHMHGPNARTVYVDGLPILENDFDRGFKTEERFYNIVDGKAVLHERHRFAQTAQGVRAVYQDFSADQSVKKESVITPTGSTETIFDPQTGKKQSDMIAVFGESRDIIIKHTYAQDDEESIVQREQYYSYPDKLTREPFDNTHFACEYLQNGKMISAQSAVYGKVSQKELAAYAKLGDMKKVRGAWWNALVPSILK